MASKDTFLAALRKDQMCMVESSLAVAKQSSSGKKLSPHMASQCAGHTERMFILGWNTSVRGTCSASRTSPKMGSERFEVRRKEGAARSAGQPARTVCSPARAGSVSGSVVGSSGPAGAPTGSVETAGGFWTTRVL
jgi:hypothetical protein